jgi:hypothetical protein
LGLIDPAAPTPTPIPTPVQLATFPAPAQPATSSDSAAVSARSLRFQRRLQRLRIAQPKNLNQQDSAGSTVTAREAAPQ